MIQDNPHPYAVMMAASSELNSEISVILSGIDAIEGDESAVQILASIKIAGERCAAVAAGLKTHAVRHQAKPARASFAYLVDQ